jgi:hypothetical protein
MFQSSVIAGMVVCTRILIGLPIVCLSLTAVIAKNQAPSPFVTDPTERGHYQQLLLGRVASLLRRTGPMRDGIVSLMEGILFKGILTRVIQCYQHLQIFFAHVNLLNK